MRTPTVLGLLGPPPPAARADAPAAEKGRVRSAAAEAKNTPERYRLPGPSEFDFELTPRRDLPDGPALAYRLTFPSPVASPYPENNTVHAEYFRPRAAGRYPAVIVLDVLAGDQNLSRGVAMLLAQNNVCGLFVQMAYYG